MERRSRGRYLAPIALIATIAGTYVIVHEGLKKHKPSGSPPTATVPHDAPSHRKYAHTKFYVVQPGDSLTSIATKTGVSVATLEALNSRIDPNSLQAHQRIRLRR